MKRAGVPAPNVPVRLLATGDSDEYSDDDKRGLAFQSRTYQTQLSGADGTVEFRGVPLGRFRLAVPGRAPIEAPSASNAANGNRVIPIDVP